jgi:hypothetical protein
VARTSDWEDADSFSKIPHRIINLGNVHPKIVSGAGALYCNIDAKHLFSYH